MATDSLISLDDFLAVTETHINEDCEQGIKVGDYCFIFFYI